MDLHRLIFDLYKQSPNQTCLVLLLIVSTLLWLLSVVEIAKHKAEDPMDRIVWLLIVLSLGLILKFKI